MERYEHKLDPNRALLPCQISFRFPHFNVVVNDRVDPRVERVKTVLGLNRRSFNWDCAFITRSEVIEVRIIALDQN
jgi:hypothetical protein